MNEQPEALRLAGWLDYCGDNLKTYHPARYKHAASELRRLHDRINTLETALRQALEALERGETQLRYEAITAAQQALGEA